MVEWSMLALNGLWVLGAAAILAAGGLSCYEAQRRGERLCVRLIAPGFRLPLTVGLLLISLSAALSGPRWWERVLWGLLCVVSVWQFWATWREWKEEGG